MEQTKTPDVTVPAPEVAVVTKKLAAKSQLETAISLWFNDGDPVSIHVLAVAAQDCYSAIGAHVGVESLFKKWAALQSKSFRQKLPDAQNFFKHGPNQFKGKIHLSPRHAEVLMFDAIQCHNLVFHEFPPLMLLYGLRVAFENPKLAMPKFAPSITQGLDVYKVGNLSRRQFLEQWLPHVEEAYRTRRRGRQCP